ncbi:single-stranded DNA-binding protein [uncultured Eubacterium sp.]|uniref:single-stranded DNA-binding protein n=1 Tax=uncultured Eubacterium sp. TaxID=165185 RepID=UPI00338E5246
MNKVILMGRLTADPEIRESKRGKDTLQIARYRLAVDRIGSDETDFVSCVVFGAGAEFVEKYLTKGKKILISGRLQTGSYETEDGETRYTTDVVVQEHFFCEKKEESDSKKSYKRK